MNKLNYTSLINYTSILYAFSLPVSRAGVVFFSFLLILFWFKEGNFKYKFSVVSSNIFLVSALILAFYMFITGLWSDNFNVWLWHFKKHWYYLVLFVLTTSLEKKFIRYVISAFLVSLLISEIISYGIFFEIWTFKHGTPNNPSPFLYHVQYSLYLAMAASIIVVKILLDHNTLRERYIYMLFFLTVTINLFINSGRIGQLMFLCSMLIVLFYNMKNKFFSVFISSSILLTVIFVSYSNLEVFKDRVDTGFNEINIFLKGGEYHGSWGTRLGVWEVTYNNLRDNLFFGVGIGDVLDKYLDYAEDNNEKYKHSDINAISSGGYHNDFLEVLSGGGLIGGFIFIIVFINLIKIKIEDIFIRNIKLVVALIFIIGLIADSFLWRLQSSIALFSLFVGIICAQNRIENKEQT